MSGDIGNGRLLVVRHTLGARRRDRLERARLWEQQAEHSVSLLSCPLMALAVVLAPSVLVRAHSLDTGRLRWAYVHKSPTAATPFASWRLADLRFRFSKLHRCQAPCCSLFSHRRFFSAATLSPSVPVPLARLCWLATVSG